jgi:simple sugar transport system ATP-binding protein
MTDSATAPETTGGPPPVVEARGVSKRFGATLALDDVSLSVDPGEVHGLVGRNGAGKSTLVSILTGLQSPDSGRVTFSNRPAPSLSDRAAWRSAAACVYQQLSIVPALSVAENLFLNRQADNARPVNWTKLRRKARELLEGWSLDIDVRRPAHELTVEQRQMVEIARSLSTGARFIILDEPTARLDAAAIARLFGRIRLLQSRGVTFLFISHYLHEIFELCQRVTVYRDARQILTAPVAGISHADLVAAMTGEKAAEPVDLRPAAPSASRPILEVAGVTVAGACTGVTFQISPGEIVGLAGGGGSGKFAVADVVVGLLSPDSGKVTIADKRQKLGSVPRALKAGVGFVPQDRHREGFVPGLTIGENVTMTVPHRLGRYGFLSPRKRSALAWKSIEQLDVVPRNPAQPTDDLSGGNQQKVVMGRALADDPRVLVMMSPTAGVDVKSKLSLMNASVDAARRGAGVLVVTDDLDDLRYCQRVLIMFRGTVVGAVQGSWDDQALVAAMEGVEPGHG